MIFHGLHHIKFANKPFSITLQFYGTPIPSCIIISFDMLCLDTINEFVPFFHILQCRMNLHSLHIEDAVQLKILTALIQVRTKNHSRSISTKGMLFYCTKKPLTSCKRLAFMIHQALQTCQNQQVYSYQLQLVTILSHRPLLFPICQMHHY